MKNGLKKLFSVGLIFVIVFSFSVIGYAEEEMPVETEEEIVATFSLMSCVYVVPISGHTWLYIENKSDEPIQVGLYEVPVGEGVSIGCFAFTSRDGWGLYYNLEALRENRNNRHDIHWSKTVELNSVQLEKLSNDIAKYPNYWDFYFNCAFFAFSIWNKNTDDFLFPLVIPSISQAQVKSVGAEKGVLKMYFPREDQVFRQKGSGDKAYLVPATGSINRK